MSSNFIMLYMDGFFLTQWAFHRVQEHPKRSLDERSYGHRKLEANNQKNDNCVPPGLLHLHTIACCPTLDEFLSLRGSEFGYTYFKEICSPISLVYL